MSCGGCLLKYDIDHLLLLKDGSHMQTLKYNTCKRAHIDTYSHRLKWRLIILFSINSDQPTFIAYAHIHSHNTDIDTYRQTHTYTYTHWNNNIFPFSKYFCSCRFETPIFHTFLPYLATTPSFLNRMMWQKIHNSIIIVCV